MLSYASAELPVRHDITNVHGRLWRRIGEPGTWWSGADRVAIAAETRKAANCELCRQRKAALSPFAVDGAHDTDDRLPLAIVDAIHRVVTDPGRLTRTWLDGIRAQGITDEQYVEAVGVVVTVLSIDTFARGVGATPWPLPEPQPGEPTGLRPEAACDDGAWVSLLPVKAGQQADPALYASQGYIPNVQRAMSLVPAAVHDVSDLMRVQYMPYEQVSGPATGDRALTRPQMELIASRVSVINGCFY